ncbi:MAG: hypothetical protein PHO00_08510 [bacterium]|nr:hypothetical protein [bacterium]
MRPSVKYVSFIAVTAGILAVNGCSIPEQSGQNTSGGGAGALLERGVKESENTETSDVPAIQKLPYVKKQRERIQEIYDKRNSELMEQMEK